MVVYLEVALVEEVAGPLQGMSQLWDRLKSLNQNFFCAAGL